MNLEQKDIPSRIVLQPKWAKQPSQHSMKAIGTRIREEVMHAQKKFPTNYGLVHAFSEECGEVQKAFNDFRECKGSRDDVIDELIQAMAMGIRLLTEGDPEYPAFQPYTVAVDD